jgi:hypothetical protein
MKQYLIMFLICISTNLFSQEKQISEQTEKRNSISIGILQGGGSLRVHDKLHLSYIPSNISDFIPLFAFKC